MIVVTNPQELTEAVGPCCVTIGNFDGVHMGHQKLIRTVVEKAQDQGLASVVVTFDPHPLRVLRGHKTPPFITLTRQKLELISALGPDAAVVLPFDKAMAALTPEQFVDKYLVQGLSMRDLVIGYDYALGKGRSGNFAALQELGRLYGYNVQRLDPVLVEGAVVSSTRIRHMVEAGDVWDVRPLLGRFYQVSGQVIRGHDRGGRLLGFPTANLKLVDELFPKPGVYAIWARTAAGLSKGVANIGRNPTFDNDALSVEAHLLDFEGDLYDSRLRVHFVQRIRDERKFAGFEELKARIHRDIELARRILAVPEANPHSSGPLGDTDTTGGSGS
jgi:riboflavin kinase/FMN adenylyltransferase